VIENRAERRLALHRADDGAEDDGHPQQRARDDFNSRCRFGSCAKIVKL
jgi:hypothetical protein